MIAQFALKLAGLLQPYLFEICLAQIVTVLVLCSDSIDRCFRRLLRPNHFIIRVTGFVLLNAFGYGFATLAGGSLLKQFYLQINLSLRYPAILSIFIIIGIIAERMKRC